MIERKQIQEQLNRDVANTTLRYRKKYKLSQEDLANITGYTKTFINRIEHGTVNISVECQSKICKAFGITFRELICGDKIQ